MARVDYNRMAAVYDLGRSLAPEGLEDWRASLRRYVPQRADLIVLDVGSGTGRFSTAFAEWFDAQVVGVDPSEGMRREALRKATDPRVSFVAGLGEALALRDAICDCAWLSTVIHHMNDLTLCARELRRVLRGSGTILIRGSFPGRLDHITVFRFSPKPAESRQLSLAWKRPSMRSRLPGSRWRPWRVFRRCLLLACRPSASAFGCEQTPLWTRWALTNSRGACERWRRRPPERRYPSL